MKIVDKGLLEVRFLRMGSNHKAATDKLEDLLHKQGEWQLRYSGAIMSTQEKEVREANNYLIGVINKAQEQDTPSSIKLLEQQYDKTIASGSAKDLLHGIYPKLKRRAQKKYNALVASLDSKSFFSSEVAETYASLWNLKSNPVSLQQNDPSRFSGLKVQQKINHKNSGRINLAGLRGELQQSFQRSLFYYPNSTKKLGLLIKGKTSFRRDHHLESRIASYQEAYTSWETKRVKISDHEYDFDSGMYKARKNKNHFSQPERYKTEQVPVTRYRTKQFPYQVLVYNERYHINLDASFKHPKFNTVFNISYTPRNNTEAHDVTMKAANLYPTSPSFLNPKNVAGESIQRFTGKLADQLKIEWKARYCGSSKTESVHRCARLDPLNKSVSLWYKKNFGVNFEDFQKIVEHNRQ